MQGLEGVRVLELGEMVPAAYAAKLMADLGADVLKVEPPGGDRARECGPFPDGERDPERSGLFLYLNTNKRSVVLDLDTDGRARLARLISDSDIVVSNLPRARMASLGLDFQELTRRRPELVLCSITPFGLTGPYADWRAEELTVANAGGWAALSPGALEDPSLPPLKAFGHQADFQGGLAGAAAALAALTRARRTGRGEHIDLSVQAYVASLLEAAFIGHTYAGVVGTRLGARGLNPWSIFECSDGLIFLCTIEQDQWERLVALMGRPEWAELEIFADFMGRLQNVDMLNTFIAEWIAPWKVGELYHAGQAQRICFAPVLTMPDLAAQDHLRARGFFVETDHPRAGRLTIPGAPYRLREPWWQLRRPAPLLGEHSGEDFHPAAARPETPAASARPEAASARPEDRGLPLEGVRVADFTWVWAGPFGAMHLAHLGADVIKFESEARPDLGRRLPIYAPDVQPSLDSSGYFNQWNQGKRSVRLNLAQPESIELARRLIAECDVLIENYATGVMERLGLGYEALRELRPDLIYASISGYGQEGPLREYMAYGPAIGPLGGLSSLTGYPGGPPRELGISYGDPASGINATVAICAALAARQQTGQGQRIDVSLWESISSVIPEGWMEFAMNGQAPERVGNRDPRLSPHGCFPCAGEDQWVSIACANETEWRALCSVIDPALADEPRFVTARDRKAHEDALEARIADWTRTRDRWDVTRALQAVGVPAFPTLTVADLAADPQLEERGFFARLEHPAVGVRTHAGIPWRLAHGVNGVQRPAPALGADTDDVLRELLGLGESEIAALREAKVLY